MPKHVGLALTVHHIWRAKNLVTLLNRHVHCISYDALKRIDTIWAGMMESVDGNPYIVIPSNIVDGVFTQAAADNADFNINNLDGKDSVHLTSVVPYQEKSHTITDHFGRNFDPDKIKSRRSINIGESKILRFNPSLVRIEPRFEGNINPRLLFQLAAWQSPSKLINWSWLYHRMAPITHFEVDILSRNEVQVIPQWTGFNTLIIIIPFKPSSIEYAPFIPAPPTDMSAVYTLLVTVKSMLNHLGQQNPVITLDEKIYAPAKEIQWTYYDELKDMVIRLGGFHSAKNFMGVIGIRMKESGLEDIWQDSNFYGEAVRGKVLEGKHYYRGERGHRITLEALERMRFQKFLVFLRSKENSHFSELIEQLNNLKRDIRNLFRKHPSVCWRNKEDISNKISELREKKMEDLFVPFKEFIELGKPKSEMFEFWDEYVEMV